MYRHLLILNFNRAYPSNYWVTNCWRCFISFWIQRLMSKIPKGSWFCEMWSDSQNSLVFYERLVVSVDSIASRCSVKWSCVRFLGKKWCICGCLIFSWEQWINTWITTILPCDNIPILISIYQEICFAFASINMILIKA